MSKKTLPPNEANVDFYAQLRTAWQTPTDEIPQLKAGYCPIAELIPKGVRVVTRRGEVVWRSVRGGGHDHDRPLQSVVIQRFEQKHAVTLQKALRSIRAIERNRSRPNKNNAICELARRYAHKKRADAIYLISLELRVTERHIRRVLSKK